VITFFVRRFSQGLRFADWVKGGFNVQPIFFLKRLVATKLSSATSTCFSAWDPFEIMNVEKRGKWCEVGLMTKIPCRVRSLLRQQWLLCRHLTSNAFSARGGIGGPNIKNMAFQLLRGYSSAQPNTAKKVNSILFEFRGLSQI